MVVHVPSGMPSRSEIERAMQRFVHGSTPGIVGLQVVGDDRAVGNVVAEVDEYGEALRPPVLLAQWASALGSCIPNARTSSPPLSRLPR